MAGKLDKKSLQKLILNNSEVKKQASAFARKLVNEEKRKLINSFLEHPVTQEIQAGESADNVSNTLGGYGNLFSFIGFQNGSNPVSPVLGLFKKININKVFIKNDKIRVTVEIPSKDELANVSKMPWEPARSWLWDIEKSISGIGAYLYGKFEESRSGKGIQLRKKFNNKNFTRKSYLTPIYNNFIQKIGGKA